jgi:hypothetical protein
MPGRRMPRHGEFSLLVHWAFGTHSKAVLAVQRKYKGEDHNMIEILAETSRRALNGEE